MKIIVSMIESDNTPVVGEATGNSFAGDFEFSVVPTLAQRVREANLQSQLIPTGVADQQTVQLLQAYCFLEAYCVNKPAWFSSYRDMSASDNEPLLFAYRKCVEARLEHYRSLSQKTKTMVDALNKQV